MSHASLMRIALGLAARNLGQTWPNPAVGALVVNGGVIVGQGATARGGRPHAEPEALAQAGENARGATLYVTLEPCNHQGKTPPCTKAIIDAGIRTCVVACVDPFAKVSGSGIAALQAAGIEVVQGVCKEEAEKLNEGFFSSVARSRPHVAIKIATSQDGKIATKSGQSKWITGEKARNHGQLLRSRFDAIVTGSGTWLADSPQLTCRLPGLENRSPQRVILDRRGRVQAPADVWVLSETSPEQALKKLANKGVTRVLVEAGNALSTAFIKAGVVDEIFWFRSPRIIGGEGLPAIGGDFAKALEGPAAFVRKQSIVLGEDILEVLCSAAS